MNRFTTIAALVATVLGAFSPIPAAAQPRGRAQANAPSAPPADDGDGPEARGVALFKLDDIIEVAVRLSPSIAGAKTDREIARAGAVAAGRDQQWVLGGDARYELNAIGADTPDNRLAPLAEISTSKLTGSLGLNRNLPTGGNISLDLSLTHQRQELNITGEILAGQQGQPEAPQSECGEKVDIFCQDQATARLTFKQPIARGVGSDVALAPQRKADLDAAKATIQAQQAAEEMIRDIVTSYWELAYAAYEVDVRAESLDLARKQEQLTRQEIRAGTAPQSSLDAVTYELATREEALLTAKLQFEQKSLELRRVAGLELGRRDILVRPKDPLELDNQEWDVDTVIAQSKRANRRLAAVVIEKKKADVDVDVTKSAMLPKIDLTLQGGVMGTGDTPSAAFSGLGGDSSVGFGYQVMAGLTMQFELSGAARAANAAALAQRHKLDITRVDYERQIDAEVTSQVKTLMSGRTRVALADKAIAVAEDNVKTERANFLAQRTNNFQVMQRQSQLIEARLRRGRVVTEYRTAVAKLQYLSGTLLDAYRIRVRAQRDD